MRGKRKVKWMAAALAVSLALTACGQGKKEQGDGGGNSVVPVDVGPVTLKLYNHSAGIANQADFEKLVLKPVQAKYPNITIEYVQGKLEDMIAAGEIPDIISVGNLYLNDLKELGLLTDLNDMVKKYKTDFGKIDAGTFDFLKQLAPNGELYAIPFSLNYGVLLYNKDIFDKFGAPYPKDNMTWGQLTELARRVTRQADGVQYIGLDPDGAQPLVRQYSITPYDPKTGKSTILTDPGFQKVFNTLKPIYDIPGIVNNNKYSYGINGFIKDRNVAMYGYWLANFTSRILDLQLQGNDFNWDITSYPVFEDKPGLGKPYDFHCMIITPTSKNRDAAYLAIATLVGDEQQQAMNRSGARLTIQGDQNLRVQFASDTKVFEGKKLAEVFKVKPAPATIPSEFDTKIYSFVNEALKNVVTKNVDINTALREADEKANEYIKQVLESKK